VRTAAAADGVAVGAWCSSVVLRAAQEQQHPLDADWREVMGELMSLRRQARTIGGLLNQLAAALNATGMLRAQAARVLGMVERVVADVDVLTARARARLRRSKSRVVAVCEGPQVGVISAAIGGA
jgi:ABC-type transporter Mla subunit MlaD